MFEFLTMTALVLVMLSVFLFSISGLIADAAEEERYAAINDVGYTIQDEIILAMLVQDGYERTFTIPQSAGRFTYTLNSSATSVQLNSGPLKIAYPLPTIAGTLTKGENTITKSGTVTIS